jgi:two-component system sensor histidine kinase RstB
MPLMFFLKLYARFAGLVTLVLVVCVALFVGVNSVRSQFWHERFPEPLMRWLQSDPDAADRYHWLGALYDFEVTSPDELDLSPVTLERLGYDQIVSLASPAGYRILAAGPDARVLQMKLDDPYQEVAEAVALIVRWHLRASGPEERVSMSSRLAEALNVEVTPVNDAALLPPMRCLSR